MLLNGGVEKTLESPLDYKEIKPVNAKGNQSWIFIGRIDVEAGTPILWPPDVKNWFIWKDPDAGKDWRQEEKGTTEDEMVGWHHRLDGHEFEQAPGVGDGHALVHGVTESWTWLSDWTGLNWKLKFIIHLWIFLPVPEQRGAMVWGQKVSPLALHVVLGRLLCLWGLWKRSNSS